MYTRISLLGFLLWANAAAAAPQAVDDVRTTLANTPITIDVLNNDSDDQGQPFTLNEQSVSTPANGTVVINADSGITYHGERGGIYS